MQQEKASDSRKLIKRLLPLAADLVANATMYGRRGTSASYGASKQKRIGVPNDQYGNPAPERPPVYGGKLTEGHDWSEFEDAFARQHNQREDDDPTGARVSPITMGGAGASTWVALPGASPDGSQRTREVAVSPNARQAATLLTGVDPYSVSREQRTANLRAAVGQAPPVQTVGTPSYDGAPTVTPIDQKYQAQGGPQIGTTRYVAPPVDPDAYAVRGLQRPEVTPAPAATGNTYAERGLQQPEVSPATVPAGDVYATRGLQQPEVSTPTTTARPVAPPAVASAPVAPAVTPIDANGNQVAARKPDDEEDN